jgi:hypothetical protein
VVHTPDHRRGRHHQRPEPLLTETQPLRRLTLFLDGAANATPLPSPTRLVEHRYHRTLEPSTRTPSRPWPGSTTSSSTADANSLGKGRRRGDATDPRAGVLTYW